jgi:hypothetical protein
MLVLTRKSNQSIMIGDDIEVSVLSEIYLEIHRDDASVPASDDGHSPEVHETLEKLGDG